MPVYHPRKVKNKGIKKKDFFKAGFGKLNQIIN